METEVIPFPPSDDVASNEPLVKRAGDDFVATWPATYPYLTMRFRAPYEDKQGVHAELDVAIALPTFPKRPEWGRINLVSPTTRAQTANRLVEQWSGPGAPPFRALLTDACAAVKEKFLEGEPFMELGRHPAITQPPYHLAPLLPEGKIAVLFGSGGTGKSYLALAALLSIQENRNLLGMAPLPGGALYLDYETDEAEQVSRLQRVADGFGLDDYQTVSYRQCYHPLYQDVSALHRFIDERQIGVVVVDSLGAAVGGDPTDAAEVIRTFAALRSLRCTVLAIDHVTKGDSQGQPFGSVYKYNYARSVWETKKAQEVGSDEIRVALVHHKSNNSRLVAPLGFSLRFDGDAGPVTIERFDVRGDESLVANVSMGNRIAYWLEKAPMHRRALWDQIKLQSPDAKENSFSQSFNRLLKNGRIASGLDGRYGLRSDRREA